MSQVTQ